jgi:hypothetical protein
MRVTITPTRLTGEYFTVETLQGDPTALATHHDAFTLDLRGIK